MFSGRSTGLTPILHKIYELNHDIVPKTKPNRMMKKMALIIVMIVFLKEIGSPSEQSSMIHITPTIIPTMENDIMNMTTTKR